MTRKKYPPIQIGNRFGRLTVVAEADKRRRMRMFECKCDCGGTTCAAVCDLNSGHTQSCGCYGKDRTSQTKTTHGESKGGKVSSEFNTWMHIIGRCHNESDHKYPDYGGRGIIVCQRWRESFETFLADVGRKPSARHTLDRFPDVNGNYEPGNVRWATQKEQQRNRRDNVLLTIAGKIRCVAEWAEMTGVKPQTIHARLYAGHTKEQVANWLATRL